jgi:hypothetical protein
MAIVYLSLPVIDIDEGSSATAIMQVRDGDAATTPTTARYRIDCLTTGNTVRGWTELTPADAISIVLDYTDNAILASQNRKERKQITAEIDTGLSTQYRARGFWSVKNNEAI